MKKIHVCIFSVLTAAALLAGMLSACGGQQQAADPGSTGSQAQTGSEFTEGTSADRLAADTTPEEEKYGGTMRLNFNGATNSLDPAQFFTNQNYVPGYHIYESPVQVADDGSVWPGVCTYEMSDDNLQLTLTVRDGVTFHNGDTVDVNDVVASIDRFLVYSTTGQANFGDYIVDTQVQDDMDRGLHPLRRGAHRPADHRRAEGRLQGDARRDRPGPHGLLYHRGQRDRRHRPLYAGELEPGDGPDPRPL